MNYTKWNAIAKGEERIKKRISELEMDRTYRIESIQKTTTKYGDKVTVGIEGMVFCYLHVKLCEALLADDEAGIREIDAEIKNASVSLRRLPPWGRLIPVEFVRNLPNDFDVE